MKHSDKNRAILAELIARSWKEPAFAQELKSEPKKTLLAAGIDIEPALEVVILENAPTVMYAVLPPVSDNAKYQTHIEQASKRISLLPENVELRVVRDSATKSHIILPAAPVFAGSGKLSDEELEQVAGGKTSTSTNQTTQAETTQTAVAETTTIEAAEAVTTAVAYAEVAAVIVPCFIS